MKKCLSLPSHAGLRRSSFAAEAMALVLLFLTFQMQMQSVNGFSRSTLAKISARPLHSLRSLGSLNSEVQTFFFVHAADDDDDGAANSPPKLTGSLEDAFLKEFELEEHKPLGCSVEESLASESDGVKHVFVAEVNDGGNAAKAGLRKGDVIVQLSGTFNEVLDVSGLGIERIRSLVSGRPDESPLVMRIARGSDVMERHELALVELCIVGDDATTADCISSIYAAEDDIYQAGDDNMTMCDDDDGTECMLDLMWSDWSSDESIEEVEKAEEVEKKPKPKKPQPWSSRSSPSGTYVRNPKTGKLENIDE